MSLAPEEMPKILLEYAEHPGAVPGGEDRAHEPFANEFDLILDLLSRTYRVNFRSSYKRGTLRRRTERRMGLRQVSDWRAYLEVLRDDPAEIAALYGDLLIGVTQFFRDPEVWEEIETDFLPRILAAGGGNAIKFWVAGCATGEEAYTLAIVVRRSDRALGPPERRCRFSRPMSRKTPWPSLDGASIQPAFGSSVSPERLSRSSVQQGESFEIGRAFATWSPLRSTTCSSDPRSPESTS